MLNTVKSLMHNVGDNSGDFAKRFGLASADIAKIVGANTAQLARRVSDQTTDIARRVGPKRGLIGLAVVAVAVGGGILLARYLRARAEEREHEDESLEASNAGGDETGTPGTTPRRRKGSRAQRKAANAMTH
ncbi:MAG: hypothetical protein M3680_32575 [Myxococcota bacterium]|nr:hypothetical protein [Myxococcota bacterium]